MKILFLNPFIDAEHATSKALQGQGVAILFPADATEAVQMLKLHGNSIDLAIVHREGYPGGSSEGGLKFIDQVKEDPAQSDLPIILTSETWGDSECGNHQNSPHGVNAYLKYPWDEQQLIEMIEAVLGFSISLPDALPKSSQNSSQKTSPKSSPKSSKGTLPSGGLVLEDASDIFLKPEDPTGPRESSITLDAPDYGLEFSKQAHPAPKEVPQIATPASEPEPSLLSMLPDAPLSTNVELSIPTAGLEPLSEASSVLEVLEAVNDPPTALELPLDLDPPTAIETGFSPASLDTLPHQASIPLEDNVDEIEKRMGKLGVDFEAEQEMPYLFEGQMKKAARRPVVDPALVFAEPMGDAVVPGGAAQTPDLETFKKYLLLREQDVAVLSTQLHGAHDQIKMQEQLLREEKAKNAELNHLANEQERKISDFEKGKKLALDDLLSQIDELRFQVRAKGDKARALETKIRGATEEMEHLKERVRIDIRKIRVREKELENRLEIMKKDSEALMSAREVKIIELKRKLDLLEFNMDLLQDQYSREKENSGKLRERLARAAQVVRVAGGLLNSPKLGSKENETESLDSDSVGIAEEKLDTEQEAS